MTPKRDWLSASDRVAHLMDALQREMIEVTLSPANKFTRFIMVTIRFDGHDHQSRGTLTFNIENRSWNVEIKVNVEDDSAEIRTRSVPAWLIEALPDETKAMILANAISPPNPDDDSIPF